MRYTVDCPYCWEKVDLKILGQHIFQEHPEVDAPYEIDIDYYKSRYGAVGGEVEEIVEPTSVWGDN